jgi:hypothetical protein
MLELCRLAFCFALPCRVRALLWRVRIAKLVCGFSGVFVCRAKPVQSPMRNSHAQPVDGAASGAGGAGRMDRARSRRERVFERETREANRLLRKVGAATQCR